MKRSEAIKALSLTLHHNWSGMDDEDWFFATGEPRAQLSDLAMWEQDEIACMAEAVLEQIEKLGMSPPTIVNPTFKGGWNIHVHPFYVQEWEPES